MISDITPDHFEQILKINAEFVHWLSPLDRVRLEALLGKASYARQIGEGQAVLIGYGHDVDYDHKNLRWLRAQFSNFYYIDRVIIAGTLQGKGWGRRLYEDFEMVAKNRGYSRLVCEVNTKPDNPGSHAFHLAQGFKAIGEEYYPSYEVSVRYYEKNLA